MRGHGLREKTSECPLGLRLRRSRSGSAGFSGRPVLGTTGGSSHRAQARKTIDQVEGRCFPRSARSVGIDPSTGRSEPTAPSVFPKHSWRGPRGYLLDAFPVARSPPSNARRGRSAPGTSFVDSAAKPGTFLSFDVDDRNVHRESRNPARSAALHPALQRQDVRHQVRRQSHDRRGAAVELRRRHRPPQVRRHQPRRGARRRPADRSHARQAPDREPLRPRHAGDRRSHHGRRRDGARRKDQQADRHADQPPRRQRGRPFRQRRPTVARAQAARAGGRGRQARRDRRRRAGRRDRQSERGGHPLARRGGLHPGDRADRGRRERRELQRQRRHRRWKDRRGARGGKAHSADGRRRHQGRQRRARAHALEPNRSRSWCRAA